MTNELEKVLHIEKEERKDETLHTALVNRLKETVPSLSEVDFKRDIVLSIPVEILDKPHTKDFIKKIGKINRTKSLGLPVELEEEVIPVPNGEPIEVVNAVFSPSKETKLDEIEELLLK